MRWDVVVATLSDPRGGLPMLVRAVAAAARRDMELDDIEEHALWQELRWIVED